MKRVLAFLFALHAPVLLAKPLAVLVDPGHGGQDRGTVQNQVEEAVLTLKVSKLVADLLKKDPRFRVHLSRTKDETLSLPARAQLAGNVKADLLVSIHVNSSPEKKARGAEFYFQNQLAPDEESMFLAHQESLDEPDATVATYSLVESSKASPEVKAILNDLLDSDRIVRSSQLSKNLKLKWTGYKKSKANSIRQAPFFVVSQARIPATLVELGFLTNADDFRDLTDPSAQKRMAQNIYSALVAYKESIDKN